MQYSFFHKRHFYFLWQKINRCIYIILLWQWLWFVHNGTDVWLPGNRSIIKGVMYNKALMTGNHTQQHTSTNTKTTKRLWYVSTDCNTVWIKCEVQCLHICITVSFLLSWQQNTVSYNHYECYCVGWWLTLYLC